MKKILATIFSAVALCMAMTSCDGYNDKELEDVVKYEPLKSVEMMVGSTTQIAAGNWVADDSRVVKVDGTTVTAVKSGVVVLNDVTSNPHKMISITVLEGEKNYTVDQQETLPAGVWSTSDDKIVKVESTKVDGVNVYTATAVAEGTCFLYDASVSPSAIYKVTVVK